MKKVLDEGRASDRVLKKVAAELSESVSRVYTLPKDVRKAVDSADI